MAIGQFLAGYIASDLFDDGLANLLALETLRHGTNPISYIAIRLLGGDPIYGGKSFGATGDYFDLVKFPPAVAKSFDPSGYFYLVKDSHYTVDKNCLYFPPSLVKRLIPLFFIGFSGYNLTFKMTERFLWDKSKWKISKKIIAISVALFSVMITPTIKMRFCTITSSRFNDDPAAESWAFRTPRKVEAWRIGILGSLCTGINGEWWLRVRKKPYKVLTGITQIGCAIGIIAVIIRNIF